MIEDLIKLAALVERAKTQNYHARTDASFVNSVILVNGHAQILEQTGLVAMTRCDFADLLDLIVQRTIAKLKGNPATVAGVTIYPEQPGQVEPAAEPVNPVDFLRSRGIGVNTHSRQIVIDLPRRQNMTAAEQAALAVLTAESLTPWAVMTAQEYQNFWEKDQPRWGKTNVPQALVAPIDKPKPEPQP